MTNKSSMWNKYITVEYYHEYKNVQEKYVTCSGTGHLVCMTMHLIPGESCDGRYV